MGAGHEAVTATGKGSYSAAARSRISTRGRAARLGARWAWELVVDCTGRATTRPGRRRTSSRAPNACWSARPARRLQDCDAVLLPGINLDTFDPEEHRIVSMASCTTNALAPVVKVLIGELRYPDRPLLDGARLHQYAVADRPADEGPARLVGGRGEYYPVVVGRGEGASVYLARPGSRARLPRACAHRQHRRGERVCERPATGRRGARLLSAKRLREAPLAGVMGVLEDELPPRASWAIRTRRSSICR